MYLFFSGGMGQGVVGLTRAEVCEERQGYEVVEVLWFVW